MKIRPMGAELFNASLGTDSGRYKKAVAFRDFVNVSESGKMLPITGYHGTSKESVF
jgi:hypothetical protein